MDQILHGVGEAPTIYVQTVGGDLRVTGWDQPDILAGSSDERSLRAAQDGEQVTVEAGADCGLHVPRRARLVIDNVAGEARLKSLDGSAQIGSVGGDLSLRQAGAVQVGRVGGDLSAKKVSGALEVGQVGGDMSARTVAGDVKVGRAGGDLYLRDVDGAIQAAAGGDVGLNVAFAPGRAYHLRAGADVICRLAPAASVRLSVAAGGDLSVDVAGAETEGHGRERVVVVRGGEAEARLEAGGDVAVTGLAAGPDAMGDFGERFGEDFSVMAEEFAVHIDSQIESQMADFEKQLNERLAGLGASFGPGGARAEEIAARVRRAAEKVERKQETAQRKLDEARRKAEREAVRARQRAERGRGRGGPWLRFDQPSPARPPASDPVTDEERMTILRMVEQGKISVADAEKLLAALENRL
jgi:hypothetical protein